MGCRNVFETCLNPVTLPEVCSSLPNDAFIGRGRRQTLQSMIAIRARGRHGWARRIDEDVDEGMRLHSPPRSAPSFTPANAG
jgi:hypothetical protein